MVPILNPIIGQTKGNTMTKANTTVPVIEFGEYVEPEKINPYTENVRQLAELDNENASMTITVDANKAKNEQFKVQKAANELGKTARLRNTDDSNATQVGKSEKGKPVYEGTVRLTFTLTSKHKARRGSK